MAMSLWADSPSTVFYSAERAKVGSVKLETCSATSKQMPDK